MTSGTTRKAIAVPHVAYNLANAVSDLQKGNAVGLLLDLIGLAAAVSHCSAEVGTRLSILKNLFFRGKYMGRSVH